MDKIYIGYDHNAVKLAEKVAEHLLSMGYEVNFPFDNNTADDDYPDIVKVVCAKVNKNSKAILLCGTGIGVCMCANKVKGMRAVLAKGEEDAYYARRHENANVLAIGAGYSDGVMEVKLCSRKALRIVDTFLSTEYEGGRHDRRLKKMKAIEDNKD